MELSRRSFMTLASGLFVPYEPERVYSFLPGYRLWSQESLWWAAGIGEVHACSDDSPGWLFKEFFLSDENDWRSADGIVAAHPDDIHDLRESARVYGVPLRFA